MPVGISCGADYTNAARALIPLAASCAGRKNKVTDPITSSNFFFFYCRLRFVRTYCSISRVEAIALEEGMPALDHDNMINEYDPDEIVDESAYDKDYQLPNTPRPPRPPSKVTETDPDSVYYGTLRPQGCLYITKIGMISFDLTIATGLFRGSVLHADPATYDTYRPRTAAARRPASSPRRTPFTVKRRKR